MPVNVGLLILSGIVGAILGILIAKWYIKRKIKKFGEKALEVFGQKILKLGIHEATELGYKIKEEDDTQMSEGVDRPIEQEVKSNSELSSVPPASNL